jgi:DNA-binding NtrC family response regulator
MLSTRRLLIIDNEQVFANSIANGLNEANYEIFTASRFDTGIKTLVEKQILVVLVSLNQDSEEALETLKSLKIYLPFIEVIIFAQKGNFKIACRAMSLGAYDFLIKSPNVDEVVSTVNRAYKDASKSYQKKSSSGENIWPEPKNDSPEIIGQSSVINNVLNLVKKVAPTNSSALIIGETGVGKELVARLIHQNSPRSNAPFIPINCGAIPETLLENELFGHAKGAFTDSISVKPGLLEEADGGTLFLDEVTELTPKLQVKLLRVIESGTFRRLGDNQERSVNLRIVSATNRNIDTEIKKNRLRSDFYYRLAVMVIHVYPLRARKDDISLLIEHFMKAHKGAKEPIKKQFSHSAMQMLLEYEWPGNIREIKNFIERIIILSENEVITPADVASALPSLEDYKILWEELEACNGDEENHTLLEEMEKKYIQFVINANKSDLESTSRFLGIPREILIEKIRRYSIMSGQLIS